MISPHGSDKLNPLFVYDDAENEAEIVEMPRNRKNSWCCGAGGGVSEAYIEFAQWTASERMGEVKMAEADLVITSCPGCKTNMWGAAKTSGVEMLDLAEYVNKLL